MLPRQQRIRTKRDYFHVFRAQHRARGSFLTVQVAPAATTTPRFGFVISSAVAKKAVTRNRIKRMLRDMVKHLPVTTKPIDMVVKVHRATIKRSELQTDLEKLYHRLVYATPRR